MPPLITHLVIGERVFAQVPQLDPAPSRRGSSRYGSFLLGCLLADVNAFSDIDRRQTHFVGRLHEDGEDAFRQSCANFLGQLDALLRRPWQGLEAKEQAFVAGYLCHLAADEYWKAFGWQVLQTLGIASTADLPVPVNVLLTAFDVLSAETYIDLAAVAAALQEATIPNVLTHVPYDAFQRMWQVARAHALDGHTSASYLHMLERLGRTEADLQAARQRHERYMKEATALIERTGGVEPHIQAAVERSVEMVPRLWRIRQRLDS